jgi:hypothetical protein
MMFLQTIVQLHILLAATPALAGWTLLMPSAHALPAHVYCLVSQSAADGASDMSALHGRVIVIRQAHPRPALRMTMDRKSQERAAQYLAFVPAPVALPASTEQHFPRAARAP